MTAPHESDAAALLDDLQQRGFVVRGEGDKLYVEPRDHLTVGERIAIATNKTARLELLDQDGTGCDVKLTLRPLSGTVPASVRLRRALKTLLRAFGLRCLRVEDVPQSQDAGDPATGVRTSVPDQAHNSEEMPCEPMPPAKG
jgi:hypothetical protein